MQTSMPSVAPKWPLPTARGPFSTAVLSALTDGTPAPAAPTSKDVLFDDDVQIALATIHELRFHGVQGIADGAELRPDIHALRLELDEQLLATVRELVTVPEITDASEVSGYIKERCLPQKTSVEESLGRRLSAQGTLAEFREYFVHRSLYLLREADAHSYAIPWLETEAKFALLEIQFDEYGSGRRKDVHAQLFANTMASVGLSPEYGHYIDAIPAITLADLNMLNAYTTSRAYRGQLMGNLCALEGTSSLGSKAVSARLKRLGLGDDTRRFYDIHVLADAVHEEVAATDLAGRMAASDPGAAAGVLEGVESYFAMEQLVGGWILESWKAGKTSLRQELAA